MPSSESRIRESNPSLQPHLMVTPVDDEEFGRRPIADAFADEGQFTQRLLLKLSWFLPLSLGLLIWELTDRTGLALFISCGHFGWRDILTAWRVVQYDPLPRRVLPLAAFHLGLGLFRWSLVTLLVVFAVDMATRRAHPQQAVPALELWNNERFLNLWLTAMVSAFAGPALVGLSCFFARSRDVRLWTDSRLAEDYRFGDLVNPLRRRRGAAETFFVWAAATVGCGCFAFPFALMGSVVVLLAVKIGSELFGLPPIEEQFGYIMMFTWLVAYIMGFFAARKSIARRPGECFVELGFPPGNIPRAKAGPPQT